jgi:type I restriction enzyme R subunit
MWLTGFDSPSMNTMYVDKPMRGANLMQAIARVNRTFKDKSGGLVVDYIGIAEDLKTALAEYTKRDRTNQEVGEDIGAKAIPTMREEHAIVVALLHGYEWRQELASGGSRAFLDALVGALDHLMSSGMANTHGSPPVQVRFLKHAGRFVRFYALCAGTPEAELLKDDAAFFEAVRAQLAKLQGSEQGSGSNAEAETAIRQIVSEAMATAGVIDLYEEAGLRRPDVSLIDEDFIRRFQNSDRKNLQLEALRRLLADEIDRISKRNVVAGRLFSDMLKDTILRYQNRSLDSARVIQELSDLAQTMTAEINRANSLGLTDDELAFYDAIRSNESAVIALGDETLRTIAHELVEIVRRDAKTDWAVKEQVRAKLRATIKRLLRRHGYPPDGADEATATVLRQAEAMTTDIAATVA